MKKAISLTFILFAGISMLVHIVIPHHHHDGVFVAIVHHEPDDNSPRDHNDDMYVHRLLTERNCKYKLVNQLFDFDHDLSPCLQTLLSGYVTCQITDSNGLPFTHQPFIQILYSTFFAHITGLRAPPIN
jgi:hypothetical protein